jgi:ATP/maltotriose-dependent transcriptional regulator MalT
MLETIREFGLGCLVESGEEHDARSTHAVWCLKFAGGANPHLKDADSDVWTAALEQEHANLRSALTWFRDRGDSHGLIRLAGLLWSFWRDHAHYGEGRRWLEIALDLGRDASAEDRLRALTGAGALAWYQADVTQAHALLEQTLPLSREVGNRHDEAFALINLGSMVSEIGDADRAIAYLEAGLALAREIDEPEPIVLALHNLGQLEWQLGDVRAAVIRLAEAAPLAREKGIAWLLPSILLGIGHNALSRGDLEEAAANFRESLLLGSARGNHGYTIEALEALGQVDVAAGRMRRAALQFAAASRLRDEIGTPLLSSETALLEPSLQAIREALGLEGFAAAWEAGRSLSRDAAIAEGLTVPAGPAAPTPRGRSPQARLAPQITEREREVLRLLASGKSNRDIADDLYISPGTVARHVANLYAKLDVSSRSQATAYAHRHGLA